MDQQYSKVSIFINKAKRAIIVALLMGLAISVLYPLAWTIMSSIRDPNEFFLNPWGLPNKFDFSVYTKVWHDFNVGHALFNSMRLSVTTVAVSLVFTLTASFAISRMRWRFSNLALGFLLAGLMIPGHSTIIPLYLSLLPVIDVIGSIRSVPAHGHEITICAYVEATIWVESDPLGLLRREWIHDVKNVIEATIGHS